MFEYIILNHLFQSNQLKKVRFIKGDGLKLTQVELISLFHFKNVNNKRVRK